MKERPQTVSRFLLLLLFLLLRILLLLLQSGEEKKAGRKSILRENKRRRRKSGKVQTKQKYFKAKEVRKNYQKFGENCFFGQKYIETVSISSDVIPRLNYIKNKKSVKIKNIRERDNFFGSTENRFEIS